MYQFQISLIGKLNRIKIKRDVASIKQFYSARGFYPSQFPKFYNTRLRVVTYMVGSGRREIPKRAFFNLRAINKPNSRDSLATSAEKRKAGLTTFNNVTSCHRTEVFEYFQIVDLIVDPLLETASLRIVRGNRI